MVAMKVRELENEIKNSARLTEPMVYRGLLPFAINVEATMGPHPPPPTESINPPKAASAGMFLVFCFPLRRMMDLRIMITPRIRVYTATTGRIMLLYSSKDDRMYAPVTAPAIPGISRLLNNFLLTF